MRLHELAIYLDYKLDESYTPNKVSIRAGASFHDLKEIKVVTTEEPKGWLVIQLRPPVLKPCVYTNLRHGSTVNTIVNAQVWRHQPEGLFCAAGSAVQPPEWAGYTHTPDKGVWPACRSIPRSGSPAGLQYCGIFPVCWDTVTRVNQRDLRDTEVGAFIADEPC